MSQKIFREMFEKSRDEGQGLVFYLNGQSLPGIVVSFDAETVVARSQEYGRIAIRVERLDGVAAY